MYIIIIMYLSTVSCSEVASTVDIELDNLEVLTEVLSTTEQIPEILETIEVQQDLNDNEVIIETEIIKDLVSIEEKDMQVETPASTDITDTKEISNKKEIKNEKNNHISKTESSIESKGNHVGFYLSFCFHKYSDSLTVIVHC